MKPPRSRRYLLVLATAGVLFVFAGWYLFNPDQEGVGADGLPTTVEFNRHVRPILSANCYVCHGPDVSTREGGLRLDMREHALEGGESGEQVIVPGDPLASALIRRINTADEDDKMPPAETRRTLSAQDIAMLKLWIEQGASYEPHWAFQKPGVPEVPGGLFYIGIDQPIDRFLLERQREHRINAAGPASKEALIRRVSYVLTGLPPTPEGVRQFINDQDLDAYPRLVDRMLASPHFGERWARHWMDLVRYADTKGHEFDYPVIGASYYRDYLIRAFNKDVPYDQLVMEHLAGDVIEEQRVDPETGYDESRLGTMYFNLGEGTHSPVDLQIDENTRIDNIIDVTMRTFQGLTVSCAKCHDHKFDPIPTTDYYSLYGVVKSTRFAPGVINDTPDQKQVANALKEKRKQLRSEVATFWREAIAEEVAPVQVNVTGLPKASLLPGLDSLLADFSSGASAGWSRSGLAFEERAGAIRLSEDSTAIDRIMPLVQTSASASTRLFGALRSPTFFIEPGDHISILAGGRSASVRLILDNFQLIQNPIYGSLDIKIEQPDLALHTFDVGRWEGRQAYVEIIPAQFERQAIGKKEDAYVDVAWIARHKAPVQDTGLVQDKTVIVDIEEIAGLVDSWEAEEATMDEIRLLDGLMQAGVLPQPVTVLETWVAEYQQQELKLEAPRFVMTMEESEGFDHPVFIRGNVRDPTDEVVARRFLSALDSTSRAFNEAGSGRLELARKMVDPANPLTARVMANRIWYYVFGKGLVESVDNFGVQGKSPSHPELLDYLAHRLVSEGWSIKTLIREMVLSDAFQRETTPIRKAAEKDPQNMLFHHYPLRRLEAEAIRDGMLAVSGRLDPTLYGESIPVHLSEFMQGRGRPAETGPLDGAGRRSIYQSVRRNFLSPFMLVFDAPIPFSTFGKRNTSNVPAQSLTLMNDPLVWQQARFWAGQVLSLKEIGTEERIRQMYLAAYARYPTNEELEQNQMFLKERAEEYALPPEGLQYDPRPWEDLAHTLFNAKEFIFLI